MSSYNKSLLNSILGGEMRNAWHKETRPGQDVRPEEMRGIDRRPRGNAYRENYDAIDWGR